MAAVQTCSSHLELELELDPTPQLTLVCRARYRHDSATNDLWHGLEEGQDGEIGRKCSPVRLQSDRHRDSAEGASPVKPSKVTVQRKCAALSSARRWRRNEGAREQTWRQTDRPLASVEVHLTRRTRSLAASAVRCQRAACRPGAPALLGRGAGTDGSAQVKQSLATALRELDIGYLDSLVMHSPMRTFADTMAVWRQFEAFVDEGSVRQLGISNLYHVRSCQRLVDEARIKPAVLCAYLATCGEAVDTTHAQAKPLRGRARLRPRLAQDLHRARYLLSIFLDAHRQCVWSRLPAASPGLMKPHRSASPRACGPSSDRPRARLYACSSPLPLSDRERAYHPAQWHFLSSARSRRPRHPHR